MNLCMPALIFPIRESLSVTGFFAILTVQGKIERHLAHAIGQKQRETFVSEYVFCLLHQLIRVRQYCLYAHLSHPSDEAVAHEEFPFFFHVVYLHYGVPLEKLHVCTCQILLMILFGQSQHLLLVF